jgi:hypothetical protein
MATPAVFFASYARADTDYEPFHKLMKTFIDDLSAKVAVKMAVPRAGICFFDESSIETGAIWQNELTEALKTCKAAVTLFSPSYFTSQWCGKEFQVFLNRQAGIVPVMWSKCPALPARLSRSI